MYVYVILMLAFYVLWRRSYMDVVRVSFDTPVSIRLVDPAPVDPNTMDPQDVRYAGNLSWYLAEYVRSCTTGADANSIQEGLFIVEEVMEDHLHALRQGRHLNYNDMVAWLPSFDGAGWRIPQRG